MKTLITIAMLAAMAVTVQADDKPRKHSEQRNYIIRRQQAYQVQGVPTKRLIIGKRQIDIYPNGLMYEKDNVVGTTRR
jgi:hypothetical protein